MFAVPGWSLPSAPITQKEADGETTAKKSKKRKRKLSNDAVNDHKPTTSKTREEDRAQSKEASMTGTSGSKGNKGEKAGKTESKPKSGHPNVFVERTEDGAPPRKKPKNKTKRDAGPDTEQTDSKKTEKGQKLAESKLARINRKLSRLANEEDSNALQEKRTALEKQQQRWNKRLLEITTSSTPSAGPQLQNATSTTPLSTAPKPPASHHPRPPSAPATALTPLQASMRAKLAAARFRHLNEALYTTASGAAAALFASDPAAFAAYHAGFRLQVAGWPANPVAAFVADAAARALAGPAAAAAGAPLPRTKGVCTVADLGAGEGALARGLRERGVGLGADTVTGRALRGNLRVVSYDLVASGEVLAADMADLPLRDGSVDVAVFCLALMGTNWLDFVDEAWRVLRARGAELWVAEIKSRFGRVGRAKGRPVRHSVGARRKAVERDNDDEEDFLEPDDDAKQEQTDVSDFIEVFRKRGFVLDQRANPAVDLSNKMFVKMRFVKSGMPVRGKNAKSNASVPLVEKGVVKKGGKWLDNRGDDEIDESKVLKPCVYKLR